jgi:hypothetical protein
VPRPSATPRNYYLLRAYDAVKRPRS